MAHFTNKFKFNLEAQSDKEAINFANQNDWTSDWSYEEMDNRMHYIENFRFVESTKDQKVDIYYDEDMNHYFFIKTKPVRQSIFDKIGSFFINLFWQWFKKPTK